MADAPSATSSPDTSIDISAALDEISNATPHAITDEPTDISDVDTSLDASAPRSPIDSDVESQPREPSLLQDERDNDPPEHAPSDTSRHATEELDRTAETLFKSPHLFDNWRGSLILMELCRRVAVGDVADTAELRRKIVDIVLRCGQVAVFRASEAYLFQCLDNYACLAGVWKALLQQERKLQMKVVATRHNQNTRSGDHSSKKLLRTAEISLHTCHAALNSIEHFRQCSRACFIEFDNVDDASKLASMGEVTINLEDELRPTTVDSDSMYAAERGESDQVTVSLFSLKSICGEFWNVGEMNTSSEPVNKSRNGLGTPALQFFANFDPDRTIAVPFLDRRVTAQALLNVIRRDAAPTLHVEKSGAKQHTRDHNTMRVVMPLQYLSDLKLQIHNICRCQLLPAFFSLAQPRSTPPLGLSESEVDAGSEEHSIVTTPQAHSLETSHESIEALSHDASTPPDAARSENPSADAEKQETLDYHSAAVVKYLKSLRKSMKSLANGTMKDFLLQRLVHQRLTSPYHFPIEPFPKERTSNVKQPPQSEAIQAQNEAPADEDSAPESQHNAENERELRKLEAVFGIKEYTLHSSSLSATERDPDIVAPVDALQHARGGTSANSTGGAQDKEGASAVYLNTLSLEVTSAHRCWIYVARAFHTVYILVPLAMLGLVLAYVAFSSANSQTLVTASSIFGGDTTATFFMILAILQGFLLLCSIAQPWCDSLLREGFSYGAQHAIRGVLRAAWTCDFTNISHFVAIASQVVFVALTVSFHRSLTDDAAVGTLGNSPSVALFDYAALTFGVVVLVEAAFFVRWFGRRRGCCDAISVDQATADDDCIIRKPTRIMYPSLWQCLETFGCWCCGKRILCQGSLSRCIWKRQRRSGSHYQKVSSTKADEDRMEKAEPVFSHDAWTSQRGRKRTTVAEKCRQSLLGVFCVCCRRQYHNSARGLRAALADLQEQRLKLIETTRNHPGQNERVPLKHELETRILAYRSELAHASRRLASASQPNLKLTALESATSCFNCGQRFNFAVNRKNCHCCGQVFCHYCARHVRRLPGHGIYAVRLSVCVRCVRTVDGQAWTEQRLRRLMQQFLATFDTARLRRETSGDDTAAWCFSNLVGLNARLLQEYHTDLVGFATIRNFIRDLGPSQRHQYLRHALQQLQPQRSLPVKIEVFYEVFDPAKANALAHSLPLSSCCSGRDLADAVAIQEAAAARDQIIVDRALKTKYHANIASLKAALTDAASVDKKLAEAARRHKIAALQDNDRRQRRARPTAQIQPLRAKKSEV